MIQPGRPEIFRPNRAPRGIRPTIQAAAVILFLAGVAALCLAPPAGADWNGRYFLFDRAVWSPDGRTVGVIGRYTNTKTGESFEDTLLVDAETGQYRCVSPSVISFVVSRDGSRVLSRGRWGLYDYEVRSGRLRPVHPSDPFHDNELELFSFNRSMDAAIVVRCSEEYPESSGVYEYPFDGGPARLLLSDPQCGPQSLNYWQSHRRDVGTTEFNLPGLERPTVIDNFPGTLWQLKVNGASETAVWGNGAVAADTLCRDCRVEFNSWPKVGGRALVSTAPENINDVLTPGDLWLLKPSELTLHLARGRFEKAAWADSGLAYVMARPGRLYRVDALDGTIGEVVQSLVPDWLRDARVPPLRIWTVRLDAETFATADSARSRAVGLREYGVLGYGLEPISEGGAYRLLAGAYSDSAAAAAAGENMRKEKPARLPGSFTIQSRPVSEMLGQFDFGSLQSPNGERRVYFRSHPHMFQPCMASEVWVQKGTDSRPRLVVRAMANF